MFFEEHIPNERLRHARHLKGWTQSRLAEMLGTDFETVSRWERGITVPSAYFRVRLCSVLEKTPEELGLIADRTEPLAPSTSPCVFLASSYADAEREFVTDLRAHLQARGVTVLSSRTLRRQGGENQRKALQAAIRTAQAVLLIASPEARSSRHVQKALQIAGIYKSHICALWIEGECWQECVPPDFGEFFATIDVRKRNDHRVFDEIIAKLEEVQLASNETAISTTTTNASAEPPLEPRNPYKGLKAFHSEDRHDFFGREALVDELAGALNAFLIADEEHARLLAVIGPSGSGKSSAVMAGLLPRLQAGGLPGSQEWVYLDPILPGVHPIESLAVSLAKHLPYRSFKTIRDDLEDDSAYGLHLLTSYLGKPPERRVVLFIDQFEEVFTQTTSEEERQHFIDLLVTAVTESRGSTILILTLRADFYDRPMHYLELCKLIESNQRLVPPMDLKGLREVIEKPAELPDVQLTFEGDLVSDLVFGVQEQVGALPLLQFTLDQLFQRRSGHQLTLQVYQEIGGVKGAVAKHAESTYAILPSEDHRKLARALFLRLIDPGVTEQDTTRRRITRSELMLPDPKETVIMEEVARAFTTARLLTTDTTSGVATVEVSHEAVIREWPRLADWLDEGREDIRLQQAISEDAADWQLRGKPKDRLYRGSQLTEAKAWATRSISSGSEEAFLHASIANRRRSVALMATPLLLLVLMTGIAVRLFLVPNVPPATLVTTLKEDGSGSLRQAIAVAKVGNTITFDASLRGTIFLKSDNLSIPKNLMINGPGAGILAIEGSQSGVTNTDQPEDIYIPKGVSVTISGLTLGRSGRVTFLNNEGTLILTNCVVSHNGGIGIENSGTLTLINSTVSQNGSQGSEDGGIDNEGTTNLINSTVSENAGDQGGGIYNNGTLNVVNSTISKNTAMLGGGIDNNGGTLRLTNSTISNNTSKVDHSLRQTYGVGGGIYIAGGNVDLTFCTIYGNKARHGGGMNISVDLHTKVVVRNSIVAGNKAQTDSDIAGTLTSDGYNLFQDVSSATIHDERTGTNAIGSSTIVGPLQNNGGPTQTHALLPGSPAIDQIPLNACHINGITTDQRGVKRPDGQEQSCDIGAYEYVDEPA